MTKPEALTLVEHVRAEAPHISACLDASHAHDGHGYRVRLQVAGRVFSVNYHDEWSSILSAWQWFLCLPSEVEPVAPPERPRRPRYLIDGIVMRVHRRRNGNYQGVYWDGTKSRYKHLGKGDPDERYQRVQEEAS